MAEAYLRQFHGDQLEIESAGMEPDDAVNSLVVEVMQEEGVDLADKKPQSVFELFKRGELYDHVVTVCHDGEAKCPIFPGITKRWDWPFPDPAAVTGSAQEKLDGVREIRDMIKAWLRDPPENSINFSELIEKSPS